MPLLGILHSAMRAIKYYESGVHEDTKTHMTPQCFLKSKQLIIKYSIYALHWCYKAYFLFFRGFEATTKLNYQAIPLPPIKLTVNDYDSHSSLLYIIYIHACMYTVRSHLQGLYSIKYDTMMHPINYTMKYTIQTYYIKQQYTMKLTMTMIIYKFI